MHSITVDCDISSNDEKDAVVVPVTSSKFHFFVGKVFDEKTGKVSTMVSGWQYPRRISI